MTTLTESSSLNGADSIDENSAVHIVDNPAAYPPTLQQHGPTLMVKPCLYTTQIVRGLFGTSIGLVLDSFTCSYKRYSGRLYVTSKAVCFFSQMFGFEKKFILWLMDTMTVCKTRKTSILLQMQTVSDSNRPTSVATNTSQCPPNSKQQRLEIDKTHNSSTNKDKDFKDEEDDDASSSSHYKFFMDDVEDADGPKSSEDEDNDESLHAPKTNHFQSNAVPAVSSSSNHGITEDNNSLYIFRKIQDRDRAVLLVQLLTSRLQQQYNKNSQQNPSLVDAITTANDDPSSQIHHSNPNNTLETSDMSYYEPLKDVDSSIHGSVPISYSSSVHIKTPLQRTTSARRVHRRKVSRSRSVTPYRHYPTQVSLLSTDSTTTTQARNNLTALDDPGTSLPVTSSRHRVWSEWVSRGEENDSIIEADTSMFLLKDTFSTQASPIRTNTNQHMEWNRTWMDKKRLFNALENEAIPLQNIPYCSLNHFFSWFMSDSAIYPMHQFLTQVIGDTNVRTSSWSNLCRSSSESFFEKTRQLTLHHRLSSNFGPSHAATTRTQTCTFIQDRGLCIQEKTEISGAPAADCFHVETIWILEPTTEHQQEHTSSSSNERVTKLANISLQVRFQIHFVKGTIFKSIISSMTRSETQHWFQSYLKIVKSVCQEQEQSLKVNRCSLTPLDMDSIKDRTDVAVNASSIDQIDNKVLESTIVGESNILNSWMCILLSSMAFLLISCLYWIHVIFTKMNRLENEMLQLRQVCKID